MAKKKNAELIGSNDHSIESVECDLFNVRQYVMGLSEFIQTCRTPMTISIQGDWGSGKTSMMYMIKEQLEGRTETLWFNTWEFSALKAGENLTISFLGRLIKKLQLDGQEESDTLNKTFALAYKAFVSTSRIVVDHVAGGEVLNQLDKIAEKFAQGEDDIADAVENLCKEFQTAVNKKLSSTGKDRLVVFIDDLDRLKPGKAVELLEILKLFLDCENCVFILAIDYNVIVNGVTEKYGNQLSSEKGKSFFDKIVQVPFKMPVAHYQLTEFIKTMFEQVQIDVSDREASSYISLIQTSVGTNPRTMKRLFNAFQLLICVSKNVPTLSEFNSNELRAWSEKILFGILCCQHAYEPLYNFIVANRSEIRDTDLLERMTNPENYKASKLKESTEENNKNESLQDAFSKYPDDTIQRMAFFMKNLMLCVDRNTSHSMDENELKDFYKLLNLTTVTSTGNNMDTDVETPVERHRRVNRTVMKAVVAAVNQNILEKDPKAVVYPVYQANRDREDTKAHWADGYAEISLSEKRVVQLNYSLRSSLKNETLDLYIWTRQKRGFSKAEAMTYFENHPLVTEDGFEWVGTGIAKQISNIGKLTEIELQQEKLIQLIEHIIIHCLNELGRQESEQ